MNKKTSSLKIALFIIVALLFLGLGILYSRNERGDLFSDKSLESQALEMPQIDILPREQIEKRIDELSSFILAETTDPERVLELRRERQKMLEMLEKVPEKQ